MTLLSIIKGIFSVRISICSLNLIIANLASFEVENSKVILLLLFKFIFKRLLDTLVFIIWNGSIVYFTINIVKKL